MHAIRMGNGNRKGDSSWESTNMFLTYKNDCGSASVMLVMQSIDASGAVSVLECPLAIVALVSLLMSAYTMLVQLAEQISSLRA